MFIQKTFIVFLICVREFEEDWRFNLGINGCYCLCPQGIYVPMGNIGRTSTKIKIIADM